MIDKAMIQHLEKLARIELSAEERQRFAEQLPRIVEYCEQLQRLETDEVAPTSAVVHGTKVELRNDEPKPGLDRDPVLAEAPDAKNGFFRVPKIIER
jgi:aspartyl-tRNA(Asn)/glutamyl-tRNA(Gln) amidotransferase subunit C